MRKRMILVAAMAAVLSVAAVGGPALAGKPGTGTLLRGNLTGTQVVPGLGDLDGTGLARVNVYPQKNKICNVTTVSNIGTATTTHLHQARAGQVGPIRLKLKPPRDGRSEHECIRGLNTRFIKKIKRNPSNYYYVDVHNNEFPGGAVRGQLRR